jgi:hypothetical protein
VWQRSAELLADGQPLSATGAEQIAGVVGLAKPSSEHFPSQLIAGQGAVELRVPKLADADRPDRGLCGSATDRFAAGGARPLGLGEVAVAGVDLSAPLRVGRDGSILRALLRP